MGERLKGSGNLSAAQRAAKPTHKSDLELGDDMWPRKLIVAMMMLMIAVATASCRSKNTPPSKRRVLSGTMDGSANVRVEAVETKTSPILEPLFTSADQLAPIDLNAIRQAAIDVELTEQEAAERLARLYLGVTSPKRLALTENAPAEKDAIEQECIAKTIAEKTKIHTSHNRITYELNDDIFECIKTKKSGVVDMNGSFRLFGRLELKCTASFTDQSAPRFGEDIDTLLARCGDGQAYLLMQFYSTFMIRIVLNENTRDYSLSSVTGISTQDGQPCLATLSDGRSNLSNGCINYKATSKRPNMFAGSPKPLHLSELFTSESKGIEYHAAPGRHPLKGRAEIVLNDWMGSVTFSESNKISYEINKNDRQFKGILNASP